MKQYTAALLLYTCIQLSSCQAMKLTTPQIIAEIPIYKASITEFIDNKKIIINGKNSVNQHVCIIQNYKTGETIATIPSNYKKVIISPDKTLLALSDLTTEITVYDTSGIAKILIPTNGHVTQYAFNVSNEITFSKLNSHIISLFNLEKSFIEPHMIPVMGSSYICHPKESKKLCISGTRYTVKNINHPLLPASSSYELDLTTYDLTAPRATIQTKLLLINPKPILTATFIATTCKYNHDGTLFACNDLYGNAYLADLTTDKCTLLPRFKKFKNIFFYRNGSVLATITYSKKRNRSIVRFWNSQTIEEITPPLLLLSKIKTLAFSPNGKLLLLPLADKTVIMHVPFDVQYNLKACTLKYLLLQEYNKKHNGFLSRDMIPILMQTILNVHKR